MMVSNNFARAIQFTLPWEVGRDRSGKLRQDGGYTNDPADPGGETKWGISKKSHKDLDITNLTLEAAMSIYKKEYYDIYGKFKVPISMDSCHPSYAVAIFDTGVNCGVNRTYNWHLAAEKTKDPVKTLLDLREGHYFNLISANSALKRFQKGWIARLNDLKKLCEILKLENSE